MKHLRRAGRRTTIDPRVCHLCKVAFATAEGWREHVRGRKHKAREACAKRERAA